MKIFIFCGGYGTRLNKGKPGALKPLLKINGKPIIEHIMKIYRKFGYKDFYLLGGYKFKELLKFSKKHKKLYNIKVINSGLGTATAGRLLYVKKFLKKDEIFFLTYGDSLANFRAKSALELKKKNNFIISTFNYKLPYGVLKILKTNIVKKFYEKNLSIMINAGFYVLDHKIFDFINSKKESFEQDVLPRVLKSKIKVKNLMLKKWQPVDNIYDIECLENLLNKKKNYFHE